MSLPASQQRILDGIEDGLQAHDVRLAALFATFTRLTRQEEMPKAEELKPGMARSPRRGLRRFLRGRFKLSRSPRVRPLSQRSADPRPVGESRGPASGPRAGQPLGWADDEPQRWETGRPSGAMSWFVLAPLLIVAAISALVLGLLVSAHPGRCGAGIASFSTGHTVSRSSGCPVRHAPSAHP